MRLKFKILETDYTEYIESLSIENHSEGILQQRTPMASMVVILSLRIPDAIVTGNVGTWGVGNKVIRMNIEKITRGKGMSEIRLAPLPVTVPEGYIRGCYYINSNYWLYLFLTSDPVLPFTVYVDSNLLKGGQQIYTTTPESLLMGGIMTTRKQSMIDHTMPKPWENADAIAISKYTVSQLQTLDEYDNGAALNVAKVEILYDDVISEDELTSAVDPTSVVISKLEEKRRGVELKYTSATTWANAFDDIRLYRCSEGNAFAVGIISGTGTSKKTDLYMSDGTRIEVAGTVTGITPEWYSHCFETLEVHPWKTELVSFDNGTIIEDTVGDVEIVGDSNKVTEEISTHNEVVRLRQSIDEDALPSDIILLGRPCVFGSNTDLGWVYYKNELGEITFDLVRTEETLTGQWLIGVAKKTASTLSVQYGSLSGITTLEVSFDGTVSNVINYTSADVYPISSNAEGTKFTGCGTLYGVLKIGTAFPAGSIVWTNTMGSGDDIAELGWYMSEADWMIVKNDTNHFALRKGTSRVECAYSDVDMRYSKIKVIVLQDVSLLIFGEGVSSEVRKIVLEAAPLPENTYGLKEVEIKTGGKGEESKLYLPFILQGGNQSWGLIPVNMTRLKVGVAGIGVTAYRSESIKVKAGEASGGYGEVWDSYNSTDQPVPGNRYYISIEVLADNGIYADEATFAWGSSDLTDGHPIVLDLNNTVATGGLWVKKSVVVQVPVDYASTTNESGVYAENSANEWEFRKPIIVNLTAQYGAGDEPTKEWCDENIDVNNGNILTYYSLADRSPIDWTLNNADYQRKTITERYKVDNDNLVVPQIGWPVLYHREPDDIEGQEGIILGYDYEFEGNSELYLDILLLGTPKPWGNSVIY